MGWSQWLTAALQLCSQWELFGKCPSRSPHCVRKTLATRVHWVTRFCGAALGFSSAMHHDEGGQIGAAAATVMQEMTHADVGLVSDSPHRRRIRRSGRGRSRSAGSPSRWRCSTYQQRSGRSSDRPRSAGRDTDRWADRTDTHQRVNRPAVLSPPSNTYTLHRGGKTSITHAFGFKLLIVNCVRIYYI